MGGYINDAFFYFDTDDVLGEIMERTGWSDTDFLALLEDAAAEFDREERQRLYAEAEDILVRQQVVIMPLQWYQRYTLTKPEVHKTLSRLQLERFEKWFITE